MQQQTFTTRDGRRLTLRPLCAEDASLLQAFFSGLSAASRRCRFHTALNGISARQAERLSRIDGRREVAFVATTPGALVVAEARYCIAADGRHAEFAIAVGDNWTGLGLARQLMALLVASARRAGLRALHGEVLAHNQRMLALMQRCGFVLGTHPQDSTLLRAEFDLAAAEESSGGWWAALAFLLPARGAGQAGRAA